MEATMIDDQIEHKLETNISGTTYRYNGNRREYGSKYIIGGSAGAAIGIEFSTPH